MTAPVQVQAPDVAYFSISAGTTPVDHTFARVTTDGTTVMIAYTTPHGITAEFSMGKEEATKLTEAARRVTSIPVTQKTGFVFGLMTQGERPQHMNIHVPAKSVSSFVKTMATSCAPA